MARAFLPTFIIGGAPRSGTTFLAQALDRHPDVYMAKPFIPEPKVFLVPAANKDEYGARYARLFGAAAGFRARGDKTSNYFESSEACSLIRASVPEVRLIFLLREPIARAYSNYLWSRKNGLETLPFAEAIACEGQRPSPLPPEKAHARPFDYLLRARYATFAERYLSAFPRDRVAFFLFEDILRQPEKALDEIQRFIDVDPLPFDRLDVGKVNSAAEVGPELDPATAAALRERMIQEVERLAGLTGLDLTCWGY